MQLNTDQYFYKQFRVNELIRPTPLRTPKLSSISGATAKEIAKEFRKKR